MVRPVLKTEILEGRANWKVAWQGGFQYCELCEGLNIEDREWGFKVSAFQHGPTLEDIR